MSKRKQEAVNLDLGSQDSRPNDLCYRNCDEHHIEEQKEARASSRRAQLTALSKVVNTAFTGWTIKTQS